MRRSSTIARLLTILIGVVLAPIATGLIASGGFVWMRIFLSFGRPDLDGAEIGGPIALQAIGFLLLLVVIATGIWSSAGLLSVGVLGLLAVLLSTVPSLLLELYRSARFVPREWIDGLIYGLPALLFPVLGAMGLVLALVRRRPGSANSAASILGIVAAPLLLGAGAWLVLWGIANGQMRALIQFRFDVDIVASAAMLGGVVLLVAGVLTTRWSAYALVLPALALIAVSLAYLDPRLSMELRRTMPPAMANSVSTALLLGIGAATAVAFLAFTLVLRRVRKATNMAAASAPPLSGTHVFAAPAYGSPSPVTGAPPYAAPPVTPPAQHPPFPHPGGS